MIRRLPTALAILLALLMVAELLLPRGAPPAMAAPAWSPAAGTGVPQDAAYNADWTAIILARPLFRPDRRPITAAVAAVDDSLPRLSAIVITAGRRIAVFDGDADAAPVAVGGRVGAYTVRAIAADRVTLLGPDGVVTVQPQYTPAAAAANAANAANPPPADASGGPPVNPPANPAGLPEGPEMAPSPGQMRDMTR